MKIGQIKKTLLCGIIVFIIFIHPALSASFGDKTVDDLYRKVLAADFLSEKTPIAVSIGKIKNNAAEKALLALLHDNEYWNQAAAVAGLFELGFKETDEILIDTMLDEMMLGSDIKSGLPEYADRFVSLLTRRFTSIDTEELKEELLEAIALTKHDQARIFLDRIISDKKSPYAARAFQYLLQNFTVKKDYVTAFFSRDDLKEYAYSWLLDHGNAGDLQVFIDLLKNKDEDTTCIIIAFEAIDKWGSAGLREKQYLDALKHTDESVVQGAMYVFSSTHSEDIRRELCRLTRQADYQDTRMIAGSLLAGYDSKNSIPYLVPLLKEYYSASSGSTGIDIFSAIITFGISAIMDKISSAMDSGDFSEKMNTIQNGLKRISGADFGDDYEQWLQWGVLNGYTIDGINIIQYLFSGYQALREKAAAAAFRLLGYKNRDAYLKDHPADKNKKDIELSLSLAAGLIEKGYLINEIY